MFSMRMSLFFLLALGRMPTHPLGLAATRPPAAPVAPRPVVLSARLIAFYGHIRASELPHELMNYSQCVLNLRVSPIYPACLSDRVAPLTPAVPPGAPDCFFPGDTSLRHLLIGSAPALSPAFRNSRFV